MNSVQSLVKRAIEAVGEGTSLGFITAIITHLELAKLGRRLCELEKKLESL